MNLNSEQLEFLEKELGLSIRDIESMSIEEWGHVREECFYIEADELLDLRSDEDEESKRCQLATSIADIEFPS